MRSATWRFTDAWVIKQGDRAIHIAGNVDDALAFAESWAAHVRG
jgi:hypothetical protein